MANQKQNRPAHTVRSGRLSVSVWLNESQNGDYYQVSPQRAYREDGAMKNSASFAENDVPLLERLLEEAYSWMRAHPPERARITSD
jgi:hypothetical protein